MNAIDRANMQTSQMASATASSAWPKGQHPCWLWIDPTRRCNLKCSLCYTRDGQGIEDLTPETFSAILDGLQAATSVTYQQLALNWRGEPTLNPDLWRFVNELLRRRPPFPVEFHTNGTRLTPELSAQLASIDADYSINVSVDGGSEPSHDANRGKGTFRRSLRGLRRLLDARGQRRYPRINIHQLDLREDTSALDAEFLHLTKEVDQWQIKKPIVPYGDRRVISDAPIAIGGTPLVRNFGNPASTVTPFEGPCFWAGTSLCVSPSGDAYVCLLSSRPDGVLGNVIKDGVDVLITRSLSFRTQLVKRGRASTPHCQGCFMEEGGASNQFSQGARLAVEQPSTAEARMSALEFLGRVENQ